MDHSSQETDLKTFEDNFTSSFNQNETALQNSQIITPDLQDPLINLTKYGLAGELRPPQFKQKVDQIISKPLFEDILPIAAPELKQQLKALKEMLSQTKYSNSVAYSDFVQEVLQKMREVYFEIYFIVGDGIFILPDRPSFAQRAKINQYFNPDIQEIAIVDIPLSSKIYLHVKSKKFQDGKSQIIKFANEDQKYVDGINLGMLTLCYKQVACESKEYLEALVNKYQSLNAK